MNSSYWQIATTKRFPTLAEDCRVDVCVLGGGITGISTAFHLAKAGKQVALLENERFGSGYTGRTTAHLTQVTDTGLPELVKRFGRDHAQAVWDAGRAALYQIHETTHAEDIDCAFSWVPAFLHVPTDAADPDKHRKRLEEETRIADELGFEAEFKSSVPFMNATGIRYANQARFRPLQYLNGLLEALTDAGARIHENCEVQEMSDSPRTVTANGHTIRCDAVVFATHVPLLGNAGLLRATFFQSKLALYTTYAIAARVAKGRVPDAMFFDTNDPYRYMRLDPHADCDYVIYGGEDHKTGQNDGSNQPYENLERSLAAMVPGATVTNRWCGQIIETHDGLPYIGENAESQFVATGYCGNGITFGTLAALMIRDAVLGRKNPWKDLFAPSRNTLGGTWDYITENVDYPYYMIRDRLVGADGNSLEQVKPGEGKLLKLQEVKVAAYRDRSGAVTTLSPVCTHLGCLVHWNATDATWDCPCHGSRFRPTGKLVAGPAESPLEQVRVKA